MEEKRHRLPVMSWTSVFDKRFRNQKGITLVELLAALAISTLFMGIIGTTLFIGLHTYQQANGKNDLQNEADYIVTSIIREIYEFSPDYIENTTNGIIARKYQDVAISDNGVLRSSKGEAPTESLVITVKEVDSSNQYQITIAHAGSSTNKVLQGEGAVRISRDENGTEPSISAQFSSKESSDTYQETGIITVNLFLSTESLEPMAMASSFGF
ncbi:PilW family protein [Pontibacillus salicampi]|uniref:PilW family protein n=2 Tax=Pontibacillus salicampi TaxID=1449801 RepID=A0ABV6LJ85_9BACI